MEWIKSIFGHKGKGETITGYKHLCDIPDTVLIDYLRKSEEVDSVILSGICAEVLRRHLLEGMWIESHETKESK